MRPAWGLGKGSTTSPVYVSPVIPGALRCTDRKGTAPRQRLPLWRAPCGRRPPSESAVRARTRLQVRNAALVSECSLAPGASRRAQGMPSERPHAAGARHRRHADLRIRFPRTGGPAGRGAMRALPRGSGALRRIVAGKGSTNVACVREPRSRRRGRGAHDQVGELTRRFASLPPPRARRHPDRAVAGSRLRPRRGLARVRSSLCVGVLPRRGGLHSSWACHRDKMAFILRVSWRAQRASLPQGAPSRRRTLGTSMSLLSTVCAVALCRALFERGDERSPRRGSSESRALRARPRTGLRGAVGPERFALRAR
jgi:hypothetical protein